MCINHNKLLLFQVYSIIHKHFYTAFQYAYKHPLYLLKCSFIALPLSQILELFCCQFSSKTEFILSSFLCHSTVCHCNEESFETLCSISFIVFFLSNSCNLIFSISNCILSLFRLIRPASNSLISLSISRYSGDLCKIISS